MGSDKPIPERCEICGKEITMPDGAASVAACLHTPEGMPSRLRAAESALSEAQQERDRWKAMFSSVADRNEEVTGHLRVVTEDRDYIADKLSRFQHQVTQQAATISQLREVLEKIAAVLAGNGMSVGYESSAGLRIAGVALASIPKEPT